MIEFDDFIRDVQDFPKPGITFKDLTPVFANAEAFASLVAEYVETAREFGEIDMVLGLEARGFIVGPPVALELGAGFVPARKPGKLPSDFHSVPYGLEYGSDELQLHRDALAPGDRVLIIDDVLATGGTIEAARQLVDAADAEPVGAIVALEISDLDGRNNIKGLDVIALRLD